MARTVDNRIVEMSLENRNFEENAAKSIKTVDNLSKSLNSLSTTKSLDISKSVKGDSLSFLAESVNAVKDRFSALGIIAATTLQNIATDAYNVGKSLISAFTVEPVFTGFSEYQTQINATQTILSNTRKEGATIERVNAALDELNHYADMTIYNFTEMTRNIGTFTAAGVDLDTSVAAIKGIANLAAISGSDSVQASRAMYQLSQAIASGTVNLQDWNSVVNAGMGGAVFQEALKETARLMGKTIDESQSFRESISTKEGSGWLTADVLLETLKKFTGDLTEAELLEKGYTKEQAKEIIALGEDANNAATKVKTFEQLLDTLKEAAQSGWTQSWMTIIGDFGEAKTVFTDLSDKFSEIIGKSAEARNTMLDFWKLRGGRDDLIRALNNVIDSIITISSTVKGAMNDIFPPMTGARLADLTKKVADFTEKLKFNDKQIEKISSIFKGFFSLLDIGKKIVTTTFKILTPFFDLLFSGSGKISSLIVSFSEWITEINKVIFSEENLNNVIEKGHEKINSLIASSENLRITISNFIDKIKIKLSPLYSTLKNIFDLVLDRFKAIDLKNFNFKNIFDTFSKLKLPKDNFLNTVDSALGRVDLLKERLDNLVTFLRNVKDEIVSYSGNLSFNFDKINNVLSNMSFISFKDSLSGLDLALIGLVALSIKNLVDDISNIPKNLKKTVSDMLAPFKTIGELGQNFANIFKNVGGVLEEYQTKIKSESILNIAKAITMLVISLTLLSLINFENLSQVVSVLAIFGSAVGSLIAIFSIISKNASALNESKSVFDKILSPIQNMLNAFQTQIKAQALMTIAKVIVIFVASIAALSFIPTENLFKAIVALSVVVAELIGISVVLNKLGDGFSAKNSISIVSTINGISTALLIMSGALAIVSKIDPGNLLIGLGVLSALMVAMGGFLLIIENVNIKLKTAMALISIASALKIMSEAIKAVGSIDLFTLIVGLNGIAALLLEIGIFMKLMPSPGKMLANSTSLVILSVALLALSGSLKIIGSMNIEAIGKGLLGIGGVLAEVALGLQLMKGSVSGALTLLIVSAAISIFAPALAGLSFIPIDKLITGLVGLAAAFAIIGAAGYLLTPVSPQILALSVSLSLIAVGVAAVITALALLSIAFSAFVKGLVVFSSLTSEQIHQVLLNFAQLVSGLYELQPLITGAVVATIVDISIGLINSMAELATNLGVALIQLITDVLKVLAIYTPTIVQSVIDILIAIQTGIRDNMKTVVGLATEIIMEFILALGENSVLLTDAAVQLIIDLINGISNTIKNKSGPLADAIVNAIQSLVAVAIEALGTAFKLFIPSLSGTIDKYTDKIKDAFGAGSSNDKFAKAGNESAKSFAKNFSNSKEGEKAGKEMADKTVTALESEKPKFASVGQSNGGAFMENLNERVKQNAPKVTSSVAGIAESFTSTIPKYGNAGSSLGSSFTSSLSNQMEIDKPGVVASGTSIFEDLTDSSLNTISNSLPYFQQSGEAVTSSMEYGTLSGEASYNRSMGGIMSGLVNTISSYESDFASAGEYCMDGLVEGFRSGEVFARNAISNVMSSVLSSARGVLAIHSPSQEFFWMGEMSDKGLALGLSKFSYLVTDSASAISNDAIAATKNTMSKISDISFDDLDANPTITPVVDLTNVIAGSSVIDNLMNSPRKFAIETSRSIGISDMLSSISGRVRDNEISVKAESKEGDNRIVEALLSLENRMAQLGEAVTNMQIIMDTGALVGQISAPMDKSLGRIANMRKRGI